MPNVDPILTQGYAVGALRIVPRWIAVDKDLAPISLRDSDPRAPHNPYVFEGSREDAERIARARIIEHGYANVPSRQFYGLFPASKYRVSWIARKGEDGRWAVLPND